MKRILIFSLAYVPFIGGAELAIKEITDRIDPNEFSFDMITLRFDRRLPKVERVGNITVHRIGFTAENVKVSDRALPLSCKLAKILFPFTSFFKALSLHRQNRYDIVWAMMANQAGFGALLFTYAHPHIPYFLELQDGNSLDQIKTRRPVLRALWFFYRRIYLKADRIKAISNFIKDLAREAGYGGPIIVIPNAVDVAKFSAPVPDEKLAELKIKFGKKMGLPAAPGRAAQAGDVFLFTASRLVLSRGVEDVIQALAHLPGHVKLLIAGDGEDKEKLRHIALGLGVESRVIFAGHVAHDALPAYFKISDIFVRPSLIEGFGSAFVEAFAAGVPVVATPVGGIPDFLQNAKTGLFCEAQNPESVARAVRNYLGNPTLVAQIVKNARELAAQKYDWNIIARDVREKVFEPLTTRG